jgi:hypothetical protein
MVAASRKKNTGPKPNVANRRSDRKVSGTKGRKPTGRQDYNETRNQKYKELEEYRESVKDRARSYYRSKNPLKESKLKNGPLIDGVDREVVGPSGKPRVAKCYTMNEASVSVGRSGLTFKKWVSEGILPEPIFSDTTYGWRLFLSEELKSIASVLYKHECEFAYLTRNHTDTIERLHDAVSSARRKL